MSLVEKLRALEFALWAEVIEQDGRLRFRRERKRPADQRRGFVYVWVELDAHGKPLRIRYVGKAGKRLADRSGQHDRGFRGNGRGATLAALLRESLTRGRVEVWVRHSEVETLWGVLVSRCEIEEAALIQVLAPTWNKLLPSSHTAPT